MMTADKSPDAYIEVKVEVPNEHADAVCDFIVANISTGLVLEEEEGSNSTGIAFYVPDNATGYRELLNEYFSSILSDPLPSLREKTIKNVEWVEEYKKTIKPILLSDDVLIKPTWDDSGQDAKFVILLEPKMAFGTGSHETTRSCIGVIRQRFGEGMRFLDFGCGSGVLSILASKMGAETIQAVDNDIAAVENCKENFKLNGVSGDVTVSFGSIEKAEAVGPYDFICANIIKSTILGYLERLIRLLTADGTLILSGLLDEDEYDVTRALSDLGFVKPEIVRDNRWLTYVILK